LLEEKEDFELGCRPKHSRWMGIFHRLERVQAIREHFGEQTEVRPPAYLAFFSSRLMSRGQMRTCTGLAALDHANTKYVQG
jgi:hypothetical protein